MKAEKTTYIIDVAIPPSSNIMKTYSEKINKYLPRADEIKAMWNMEKVVVPIILETIGEIPRKLYDFEETEVEQKYLLNYAKVGLVRYMQHSKTSYG